MVLVVLISDLLHPVEPRPNASHSPPNTFSKPTSPQDPNSNPLASPPISTTISPVAAHHPRPSKSELNVTCQITNTIQAQ
jgi:hypothetical protein